MENTKIDINNLIAEKFKDRDFEKKYHRTAAFYRLADELLLLRKKRGLTQKELAEKAGTTQAVVSRLESASVKPSIETVLNFAEALDAVLDFRLTPIEDARRKSDELNKNIPREKYSRRYHIPINSLDQYKNYHGSKYFFSETQSKYDLATLLFTQPVGITKKEIEYA